MSKETKSNRGRPPVEMSRTKLSTGTETVEANVDDSSPEDWVLSRASTEENTDGFLARILFPDGTALQRILSKYREMYESISVRITPTATYFAHMETNELVALSISCTKVVAKRLPKGYYRYVGNKSSFGVSFRISLLDIKDTCSQMSRLPIELVVTDDDKVSINMFSPSTMSCKRITLDAEKATEVFDAERYMNVSSITVARVATVSVSSKAFCADVPFSKTSTDDNLYIDVRKNKITFKTKFKSKTVSVDFYVADDPALEDLRYSGSFPAKKAQAFIRGSSKLNISVDFMLYDDFVIIWYEMPGIGTSMLNLKKNS